MLRQYAVFCGWALARGHAKGGGCAAAIAGYLGRKPVFDEAITAFAQAYADQNQRDYETLAQHFKGNLPNMQPRPHTADVRHEIRG